MKRSLTLLFLLAFHYSPAQQVLFSENFESFPSYTITGWQHNYTGAVPWEAGLPYLVGGMCNNWPGTSKIAGIPDCGIINYNNSSVMMNTPVLNLQNITSAWLRYDSYFGAYSQGPYTEVATVEVSTNGGSSWDTLQLVPAVTALGSFNTYFLDLSAYNNQQNVRIGFRYSDGGGHLQGWAVDNVEVFAPFSKDLKLVEAGPVDTMLSYAAIGGSLMHSCKVFNYGLDTVSSFVVKYRQGNGPVEADTVTGVQILPFSYYQFTHHVPDTLISAGRHKVTMWVELAGDGDHSNDTATCFINGVYFMPEKQLVVEEGTGTFDVWGPRGRVYMDQAMTDGAKLCAISVHGGGGDPMGLPDYSDTLFYIHWNYVPFFLFDRRQNVPADSFFSFIEQQKHYFGFAEIATEGSVNNNQLEVQAHLIPAMDLHGDFRLVLVVTENDVTGTTSAYDQRNHYAGGAFGPMGGYENKPDPVPAADMHYNFVARGSSPTPAGAPGLLPTTLLHGTQYDQTLTLTLDPSWNINRLNAHVLLLRYDDSSILNSKTLQAGLAVRDPGMRGIEALLYPNPSSGATTLYFRLEKPESISYAITDLTGRLLLQGTAKNYAAGDHEISLPTDRLSSGIYLVSVMSGRLRQTLKLEILK